MSALYLLLLLPALIHSHEPYFISEQSRFVPSWDSYPYFAGDPSSDDDYLVFREYVLSEESARAYFLCPRGFAIGQIAYALLLGSNATASRPELMGKTSAHKHHLTLMQFPHCYGDRTEPVGESSEEGPFVSRE